MTAAFQIPRAAVIGAWLFGMLVLGASSVRLAQAAERMDFDIPRGPAARTLTEFAAQSGLQVLFAYDDVQGIETNAVHGKLSATEALDRLVKGTRLGAYFPYPDAVTLTVAPPPPPPPRPRWTDRRSMISPIEEVTVRAQPETPTIGQIGSRLSTLTRPEIDSRGVASLPELLRTVPQVFGGGPTEDTQQGFEALTNAGSGTGINLRGLGAGSTLVLVNGRRMSGSGTDGIFVDISNLPLSLVERVEILPDSSSTRFGADAVGGVVNLVLRDSFSGTQTDAYFGAATQSTVHEDQVSQLLGLKGERLSGLLALDYYDRENLPAEDRRQARSNLTGFGGDNFDTPQSNPGTILFSAPVCRANGQPVCPDNTVCTAGDAHCTLRTGTWAIPAGQDGTQLRPEDLIPNAQNLENRYAGADLLPTQKRLTLYGTTSLRLGENAKLFADLLYGERDVHATTAGVRATLAVPSSNPYFVNPTGKPLDSLLVAYDFTRDLGPQVSNDSIKTLKAVLGADYSLASKWRLSGVVDFASERLDARIDNAVKFEALTDALADTDAATALNVFGDGPHTNAATLAGLRTAGLFDSYAQMISGSLTASRDLPAWWHEGGTLMVGIDARGQSLHSESGTTEEIDISHDLHRDVQAGFVAASVPMLDELTLSLGSRFEHYSDFGYSRSPRFGLNWRPLEGLALHGTWSRSFRPPNLVDLDESHNYVTVVAVRDPDSPGDFAPVLVKAGKNRNLHEERARNWTLGVDLEPRWIPGLTLAATYFDTNFMDRMSVPVVGQNLLTDPALADLIVREPTAQQLAEACSSAPFLGTRSSCASSPVKAIADLRVRNSAFVRTSGIDMRAEYGTDIGHDSIKLTMDGTYILSFRTAESLSSPAVERVSTQNNPIDLRLHGSVSWTHQDLQASAHLNYFDGYRDTASNPARSVRSWTTLDLRLAYTFSSGLAPALDDTTLALGVQNLFDQDPPFLNNQIGIGYDQENGDLLGRMVSVSLRKKW